MDKKLTYRSFLLMITTFMLLFPAFSIKAQGIKGKVLDHEGEPLPFTSILLLGTNNGVASNLAGEYSLSLAPGKHRLRFQYLGFRPLDTTIVVSQTYVDFNPRMQPEVVALRETTVGSKGEDPAYTIMRRAI